MAEIRTVSTGSRVEIKIKGRVFRADSTSNQPKSRERRRVCVLNAHDGRMIEHWGVGQPCHGDKCRHSHQTRAEVEALVREGILHYIPGSDRNVAAYSFARTWKGAPSGAERVRVMQLV